VVEHLYYKERRQLKTFLTQIGPALPLTPDPPVRLRNDKKVERLYKSQFGEHFCQKHNVFLTHPDPARTHPPYLLLAHHPHPAPHLTPPASAITNGGTSSLGASGDAAPPSAPPLMQHRRCTNPTPWLLRRRTTALWHPLPPSSALPLVYHRRGEQLLQHDRPAHAAVARRKLDPAGSCQLGSGEAACMLHSRRALPPCALPACLSLDRVVSMSSSFCGKGI
jgi:hypothetical protein